MDGGYTKKNIYIKKSKCDCYVYIQYTLSVYFAVIYIYNCKLYILDLI